MRSVTVNLAVEVGGETEAYGPGVRGVAGREDVVRQIGAEAVGGRPGQGRTDEPAAQEQDLAVVADATARAVRLAADLDVQTRPGGQRGEGLAAGGVRGTAGVEPGHERAVVARGVQRPARLLAGGGVARAGGRDAGAEVAVADVGVVRVVGVDLGGGGRPGGIAVPAPVGRVLCGERRGEGEEQGGEEGDEQTGRGHRSTMG